MPKDISESIFDNGKVIIPFAEVSHIERPQVNNTTNAIVIVFKHSRYINDEHGWEPNVFMQSGDDFIKCWCIYRREAEGIDATYPGGIAEQMKEIWK